MTQECREDIDSSLGGFLSICSQVLPECPIIPGYINSDVVENFFCQQRGVCHGLNTNPTVLQYGPAVNATIIGQKTVSRKSNAGHSHAASLHDCVGRPKVFAKKLKMSIRY